MSARRLGVAARAALTLLGVAATSGLLLLAATEVAIAAQGEHVAPWIGLGLVVTAAVAGWLTLWAAAGRNPLGAVDAAGRETPRRLRVAQGLLAVSALLLLFFLAGIPFPPPWRAMATAVVILAMFVAALYAALTLTSRDPRGRHVALALGAWMVGEIVHSTLLLARAPARPDAGPAIVLSYLLAWSCYGAAILASFCVLSLRGAWPRRNPPG